MSQFTTHRCDVCSAEETNPKIYETLWVSLNSNISRFISKEFTYSAFKSSDSLDICSPECMRDLTGLMGLEYHGIRNDLREKHYA